MKNDVANKEMNADTKGILIFLVLTLLIGVPSIIIFGWKGVIPFLLLWAISMFFAYRVEKTKKKYNLKTYQEIIAFSEGSKDLEVLIKQRDEKNT
ncbi:hypothetical protein ACWOAH_02695 [Vagococcus vulneris]|uniref:hypothetical protein n=1 Tax=Vagococcus vulneris TaxID=1977869 RepID=UPI00268EB08C